MAQVGRTGERLALSLLQEDYPSPRYQCLWRDAYLDSERQEIRRLGIIADIDVWDSDRDLPAAIVEVKVQKVTRSQKKPQFYLSRAEWRGFQTCVRESIDYQLWLFQYFDIAHFESDRQKLKLIVFDRISEDWLDPESYRVSPTSAAGEHFQVAG